MHKVLAFTLGFSALAAGSLRAQQVYVSRNAGISFYSSAPIEDIQAKTSSAVSAINIATGAVYFKVGIRSFHFERSLMEEHFNTDYMESDKYPYAEFKGKLQGLPAGVSDGDYPVTVQGQLTIHGVTKAYTDTGTLSLHGGVLRAAADFKVRLADHHIKIPSLLFQHIAEVVDVKVNASYTSQEPAAAAK